MYPTEEQLETVKTWTYDKGWLELCQYIKTFWEYDGVIISSNKKLDDLDRIYTEVKFITCGWSGNEDIIRAMNQNVLFGMMCWESSHRGGLHIYRLYEK